MRNSKFHHFKGELTFADSGNIINKSFGVVHVSEMASRLCMWQISWYIDVCFSLKTLTWSDQLARIKMNNWNVEVYLSATFPIISLKCHYWPQIFMKLAIQIKSDKETKFKWTWPNLWWWHFIHSVVMLVWSWLRCRSLVVDSDMYSITVRSIHWGKGKKSHGQWGW
jgi:hypothetical protein